MILNGREQIVIGAKYESKRAITVVLVITVDNNPAYPTAIKELKAAEKLLKIVKSRQIKYFNNIVEQDHPWLKRLVKPGMGFGSFSCGILNN
jgi:transposase-like protein